MKNLKELTGVKVLSKTEQKSIKGGMACSPENGWWCPEGSECCIKRWSCYIPETYARLCS